MGIRRRIAWNSRAQGVKSAAHALSRYLVQKMLRGSATFAASSTGSSGSLDTYMRISQVGGAVVEGVAAHYKEGRIRMPAWAD